MSTAQNLLMLGALALAVYIPKALPLLLLQGRIPPAVQRWLKYVAPAVLAAMVAPSILTPDGQLTLAWSQLPFLVTLIAALVSRHMLLSVAAGLSTLIVLVILHLT